MQFVAGNVAGGVKNVGRFINFVKGQEHPVLQELNGDNIYQASFNGNYDSVKKLAEYVNINLPDAEGWTPLHYASWQGQIEIVTELLRRGAKTSVLDKDKRSALHLATYKGHYEVIQTLIKWKSDIELKDSNQLTPLHRAVIEGHVDSVRILVENQADLETLTPEGLTVLHLAAWKGHKSIIQFLVKFGMNVNVMSGYGSTPLHEAVVAGRKDSVHGLLSFNADINIRDMANYLPEDHAYGLNYFDIYKVLKDYRNVKQIPVPQLSSEMSGGSQHEIFIEPQASAPDLDLSHSSINYSQVSEKQQSSQPLDYSSKEQKSPAEDERYKAEVQRLREKMKMEKENAAKNYTSEQSQQEQYNVFKFGTVNPVQDPVKAQSNQDLSSNLSNLQAQQQLQDNYGYQNVNTNAYKTNFNQEPQSQQQTGISQPEQPQQQFTNAPQTAMPSKQSQQKQNISDKEKRELVSRHKYGDEDYDDDDYFDRKPEDPDYGWNTNPNDADWGESAQDKKHLQVNAQRDREEQEDKKVTYSGQEAARRLQVLDMEISRRNGWIRGMDAQSKLLALNWLQIGEQSNPENTDKIKAFKGNQPEIVSKDIAQSYIKEQANDAQNSIYRIIQSQFCPSFTLNEVQLATKNFSDSNFVEQNSRGKVYRGTLQNTQVLVQVLDDQKLDTQRFLSEVEMFAKLRHPHLARIMGICQQSLILIFEMTSGVTLQSYMNSQPNSGGSQMYSSSFGGYVKRQNKSLEPLGWFQRLRIAMEVTCTLVYLQNAQPKKLFVDDLEALHIQLDSNQSPKLDGTTVALLQQPNLLQKIATLNIQDQDYQAQKEMVYLLGKLFLKLLSNSNHQEIIQQAQQAYNDGQIMNFVGTSNANWPIHIAMSFYRLALKCVDKDINVRLQLGEVLQQLKTWTDNSFQEIISNKYADDPTVNQKNATLPCYLCPLTRQTMLNPMLAADGFTYEKEAIEQWIQSGCNTSPMTNAKLEYPYLNQNTNLREAIIQLLQNQNFKQN